MSRAEATNHAGGDEPQALGLGDSSLKGSLCQPRPKTWE